MIRQPVAVVFDCDGVLVDSEPHSRRSWLEVLEVYRHPATPSDLDACTGLGFGPTHAALSSMKPLPDPDEVWPRLLHALAQSFDTGLSVFADAVGVLDAAADAGLALGVASASPRSRLDLTLRVAGLADRWAVSVAGDEVDSPKPAPDVYVAALAALGCAGSDAIAIEDSRSGVEAGFAAGMSVVAVVRTDDARSALEASGAVVVDQLSPSVIGC